MANLALSEASWEQLIGNEYLKAQKFEDSIACYSKAIILCDAEEEEQLSVIFANRAVANLYLQRYTSAIDDSTQSFMLDKKYWEPLYHRYVARLALGQLTEALVDIVAVCMLEKEEDNDHVTKRNELLLKLSRLKTQSFTQNLPKIRVRDCTIKEEFCYFKNHALFNETFDAEKVIALQSYLKITPNIVNRQAKLFLTEAIICFLHENWMLAEKLAEIALRSTENDTKLSITAMIYIANSKMMSAVSFESVLTASVLQIFEDALHLDQQNVDIYLHRAICCFQMNANDRAFSDLERCAVIDSTFEAPHLLLLTARIALEIGTNPHSKKQLWKKFEQYIRQHSYSIEGPIQYANILYNSGETDRAVDVISSALQYNADNSKLLQMKAELLIEHDAQAVRPLLIKALGSDCIHKKELFLMLAFVAAEQGNFEEALVYTEKPISQSRCEAEFRCNILSRDLVAATMRACRLLGFDTNKSNCSALIKYMSPDKHEVDSYLHDCSCRTGRIKTIIHRLQQ